VRQPGVMERAFSRVPGAGPGFGGMVAGSLLGSVAGTVLGTMIAQNFLDGHEGTHGDAGHGHGADHGRDAGHPHDAGRNGATSRAAPTMPAVTSISARTTCDGRQSRGGGRGLPLSSAVLTPFSERRREPVAHHSTSVQCAVPGNDLLGETPLWCDLTQSLLWLDIDGGRLQRFHPGTGRHDSFEFEQRYVGSLALTCDPAVVLLGIDLGLHLFNLGSGELRQLCQVEAPGIDNRLNDGRCDSRGRFWVGTMDNKLHRPNGAFYRVDPDGTVHRQFGEVIVSNTVAFSPAQDRLYFSDTRRFTTWRFDLDVAAGRFRTAASLWITRKGAIVRMAHVSTPGVMYGMRCSAQDALFA
jgi:sugar lactone lactonase YvrE